MLTLVALHLGCAALLPLLARRVGRGVWAVAAAVPLVALGWALSHAGAVLHGHAVTGGAVWAGTLGLRLDARMDALALLMICVVSGIGAAVFAYSAWAIERDTGRDAALLLAFAGVMFGLVTADNVFLLYVFWELTTLVSFLLIAGRGRGPEHGAERRRAAEQSLVTTAAGGLVLLLGLVMLGQEAGSYRLSEIVADPPRGGTVTAALVLVLIGAFAKSALFPLHAWLPAAMVAPTPVSAYLHAAAMVKAGVYLVARLAPGFADAGPWRPLVLVFGLLTMVAGAWGALRQTDLKRLLAYSTISELGMLIALLGDGTRTAALAGADLLLAHALFKAGLFMVTGIVDHQAGTRDLRVLSRLGARLPGVCAVAALAAASLAGVPPLLGYLGEEASFEAFLHGTEGWGGAWVPSAALAGLALGTMLKVAYAARFLWGAFARKPGVEQTRAPRPAAGFLAPAALLAVLGLVAGLWPAAVQHLAAPYADTLPQPPGAGKPYELALWHGLTAALLLSVVTLLLGIALHLVWDRDRDRDRGPLAAARALLLRLPRLPDAQRGYQAVMRGVRDGAVRTTRATQVGSLPVYLTVLLITVVVLPGTALVAVLVTELVPSAPALWHSGAEVPLALVVLTAAVTVTVTRHRLAAVLLTGAVGYGVAGLFVVWGAPDVALTQFLVESLTLVVMVLVLRRLPLRFTPEHSTAAGRWVRGVVAVAAGAFVALFAVAATDARRAPADSEAYLRRVAETGGENVVNAILVDFRALDTLGEIAVLLVTAIGVRSLFELWRGGTAEPLPAAAVTGAAAAPGEGPASPAVHWDQPREQWLPGAADRPGSERSVLMEVVTRLMFSSLVVLSLYLLFSGHYAPGGGFIAGLVAGQAFVLRYLVGGRTDLGLAAPVDPGVLAGGGLALAAAVGAVPLAFGDPPLSSALWQAELPLLGTVKTVSSLCFDAGIYLLVIGVILKLLAAGGRSPAAGNGRAGAATEPGAGGEAAR